MVNLRTDASLFRVLQTFLRVTLILFAENNVVGLLSGCTYCTYSNLLPRKNLEDASFNQQ